MTMARQLANKTKLRAEIKTKLLSMSKEEKLKQSQQVAQKLYKLDSFIKSQRVSIYLSTENELDTLPILNRMFDMKKRCFVPSYEDDLMEMLSIESLSDYKSLPLTKWKIKQPAIDDNKRENAAIKGLDMIIVPGLAFTTMGHRLGKGKGYYDKYLKKLRATKSADDDTRRVITVGLAFKEQIVDHLEVEDHDESMDVVIYPTES